MSLKIVTCNNDPAPVPDWKIQKVSKESVYPKGIFNFKGKSSIQTTTGDISSNNDKVLIPLLDPHVIAKHKKLYRYVHVGLVQVFVKPLMQRGVNGSISLFLKDKRLFDFSDSYLNVPQASELNDPINFFPNFMVPLEEVDVLHHLTLEVKFQSLPMERNKFVLSLTSKVHYKWKRDQVNPAAKSYGPGIEVIFQQRNMRSPKDSIPKTIKRSDAQLPDEGQRNLKSPKDPIPKTTKRNGSQLRENQTVQDENLEEEERNSPRFIYVSGMNVKHEFPPQ